MPEIVNPLAEAYAAQYSSPEDALLAAIAAETNQSHNQPHMLSGRLQGRFLEIISRLIRPERILEIGTMVGYSTICLARGLQNGGKLHTIELRAQDADIAENNFYKAGMEQHIILHRGNALEIIPTLDETWDLVFLDADKVNYIAYYELVKPRLRKGGCILADNVLFHGTVLTDEKKGKNTKAVHEFNQHVQRDNDMETVILTIRDGLMMSIKK